MVGVRAGVEHHLRQPFRGAHDAVRVHRLVGGDHDEPFGLTRAREIGDHGSAEDIVFHHRKRVHLAQRDVLERRRVIHDLRCEALEHVAHAVFIGHRTEHRDNAYR